jgi:enoyl-CoA hydratase/carnithine racemase
MSDLLVERNGHVTVFTLNRPQKLNALTRSMGEEFMLAMAEFDADHDQYVAIITGAGDKAFSSGVDLTELASVLEAGSDTSTADTASVDLWGLGHSPKPIIAAVNGLAVAGGLELCLSCDIRIVADSAWLGVFEVKRGIMARTAVNLLTRYIPIGDALYMLLTADRISAQDALRLGLAQKVVDRESLMDVTMGIAEMITQNSQVAVQASKRVAYYWRNLAIRESMDYYDAVNQQLMVCDDVFEGVRAFAEKRAPRFNNRWPERSGALLGQRACIYGQGHTGDVPGRVRGQPKHCLTDVPRLKHRHGQQVDGAEQRQGVVQGRVLKLWTEPAVRVLVGHHVGADRAGQYGVNPDGVAGQLHREAAHEADDPVLGGGVVRAVGEALLACSGTGDRDRATATGPDESGDRGLDRVPDTCQVDVDDIPPLIFGQFPSRRIRDDPRVGAHDI